MTLRVIVARALISSRRRPGATIKKRKTTSGGPMSQPHEPSAADAAREGRAPDTSSGDNALPSTVEHLIGGAAVPARSEGASRFRVLRPHARGGLGEVFLAVDEQLQREVALKQMKPQFADRADSRGRFVLEAEVTGRLEHPGIVPVYGLGSHPDGTPYYAMRFIRGESLQEAVDRYHNDSRSGGDDGERTLAFRDLLRRFVDVCNAIAYAHSKGVLHRDLKPANVMLGPFGETLVVDWGLAKVLGTAGGAAGVGGPAGPATATQEGAVVGTPAFMSPEQAAGRTDALTPASDIYSLGAMLYVLLTGRPPFTGGRGGLMDLLANVRAGAFPPPRQVRRDAPPALEAVCLKAMALSPRDRYGSAKDLAADVDHYLADELVAAYREPASARLRRWGRRHRPVVAGLVVLLVTALAASAVGLAVVGGQMRRTDEANRRLREEEAKAHDALLNETEARKQAQEAERDASQQRELALATLRGVVDDLHEELKNTPAQQELRKKLLGKALAGLKDVARAADTTRQADHTAIYAHFELGDLFFNFEEGGLKEAAREYQTALELARRRDDADPGNREAQRDLGASYERLGNVRLELGDTQEALASYEKYHAVARKLARADPSNLAAQRDLALSHERLGKIRLRLGDTKGAEEAYRQYRAITEELAAADPDDREAQRDLLVSHERWGAMKVALGDTRAALEAYQKNRDLAQKMADATPNDARAQRDLAAALSHLGDVQVKLGNTQAALESFRQFNAICRKRADADPRSTEARRDLAISHLQLGAVRLRRGDTKAGLEDYEQFHALSKQVADADPTNAEFQRDLASSHKRLGDLRLQLGDAKAALEEYQAGLAIRQKLADADPGSAHAQHDVAAAHANVGDAQMKLGEAQAALQEYRAHLAVVRKLADADPDNAGTQRDLAASYQRLGVALLSLGDAKGALEAHQHCLEILRKLARADPKSAEWPSYLAMAHARLGEVHLRLGDTEAALVAYQAALALRQELADADPGNAQARRAVALSHNALGGVYQQQGETQAAVQAYRAALAIRAKLAEADPTNVQAQRDLFVSLSKLGSLAEQMGDFAQAADWYEKALAVPRRSAKPDVFRRDVAEIEEHLRSCRAAGQKSEGRK
jgi:tetratricopeptide (TPR) repeat protein/tRNA A-37 threonylcarbamoyl transferase component Bud32